ncbi:hypothetical protein J6590_068097 [Homalodisca vitripennis]|nr:hypothetical protein J6590_068097 [Homalodisca vitripennis]
MEVPRVFWTRLCSLCLFSYLPGWDHVNKVLLTAALNAEVPGTLQLLVIEMGMGYGYDLKVGHLNMLSFNTGFSEMCALVNDVFWSGSNIGKHVMMIHNVVAL